MTDIKEECNWSVVLIVMIICVTFLFAVNSCNKRMLAMHNPEAQIEKYKEDYPSDTTAQRLLVLNKLNITSSHKADIAEKILTDASEPK